MQQKAQRDAERKRRSEALSAQRMTSFRGLDRQTSIRINQRKQQLAGREAMKENAANMASFRGLSSRNLGVGRGLSPVIQGKKACDLELGTLMEENAQKRLSGVPERGLTRQRSSFGDYQEIKEDLTQLQKEIKPKKAKSSKKKDKKDKKDKKKKKESSKSPERSKSKSDKKDGEKKEGKERKTVELDFSFGIITDLEIIPDMQMIESAAIFAVRDILQGSQKECGIRTDPDMPQVEPDVEEDVWYDSEYEIRWKIKGKVVVKIYVAKSLEATEAAAPVQKMLKRYTSYQEVEEAGGKVKSWARKKEDRFNMGGLSF